MCVLCAADDRQQICPAGCAGHLTRRVECLYAGTLGGYQSTVVYLHGQPKNEPFISEHCGQDIAAVDELHVQSQFRRLNRGRARVTYGTLPSIPARAMGERCVSFLARKNTSLLDYGQLGRRLCTGGREAAGDPRRAVGAVEF